MVNTPAPEKAGRSFDHPQPPSAELIDGIGCFIREDLGDHVISEGKDAPGGAFIRKFALDGDGSVIDRGKDAPDTLRKMRKAMRIV